MPGIAGIVTRQPGDSARAQVQRMVGVMCHERSYRSGTWTDEKLGLYIGWTARQGSFAECLPLRNEQGDRTLFFAGENYAALDHVQRLRQRHAIDGDGASYLVQQAEEDEGFP
jgi:asparagine synthetase B (glutamine-hydrolysing)